MSHAAAVLLSDKGRSQIRNFGVDTGFYPLGSCTMKYNPKASELWARLPKLTQIQALMIEPAETEDKATLDAFVSAMRQIADEARNEPQLLRDAPHSTPVRRLDELKAARELIVSEETR